MTLSKLAQLANVSVSVVSKAFSGRADISDAMREHVFAVAREHGCFRQFYHVPYDKPVIAVIVPEVISQHYVRYIQMIGQALERRGYTMLLSISNFDSQLTAELVRYYTDHGKVDGLLLLSSPRELGCTEGTAVVSIGSHTGACDEVYSDLGCGLRDALLHLKKGGYTRVAFVGEAFTVSKQELFKKTCAEEGLVLLPEWSFCSRQRFLDAGEDGVRHLLSCRERPEVIFGAYSYITKGILRALRHRGVRVPDEMGVVSMNTDSLALDEQMDVACIPTPFEQNCEQAIELLCARVQNKDKAPAQTIRIPTVFHPGDTILGK